MQRGVVVTPRIIVAVGLAWAVSVMWSYDRGLRTGSVPEETRAALAQARAERDAEHEQWLRAVGSAETNRSLWMQEHPGAAPPEVSDEQRRAESRRFAEGLMRAWRAQG